MNNNEQNYNELNGENEAPVNQNPGYQNPGYQNPGYQNPGYQNPGYQNPGCQNPGYQNPGYQNPGYQNPGYQNPGYQNPGYQNPGYQNPGYQNSRYQNPGYQNSGYQNPGGWQSWPQPAAKAKPNGFSILTGVCFFLSALLVVVSILINIRYYIYNGIDFRLVLLWLTSVGTGVFAGVMILLNKRSIPTFIAFVLLAVPNFLSYGWGFNKIIGILYALLMIFYAMVFATDWLPGIRETMKKLWFIPLILAGIIFVVSVFNCFRIILEFSLYESFGSMLRYLLQVLLPAIVGLGKNVLSTIWLTKPDIKGLKLE